MTQQRLLMLDIDGVLNSAIWFEKMACDALSRRPIHHMLDPECVARLNQILDKSGAHVIVSSSWRCIHNLGEIDAALRVKGFTGKVIGVTPKYLASRGHEIAAWLEASGHAVEQIVILDDDSDMAHLATRHVKTAWATGITDADVEKALLLFGLEDAR